MSIDIASIFNILTTDPLFEAKKLSGGAVVVQDISESGNDPQAFRAGRMYISRSSDFRLYSDDGSTFVSGTIPSGAAMTGTEIIQAIEDDPTDPKLPAADVADLTGTMYRETDQAILIDPIDKTYIEIQYEHTGAVTQTMPNLVNSRDGLRFMVRNSKTDDSVITLLPANPGQTVDGVSSFDVDPGVAVLFIAMTGRNSWHKEAEFEHDKGPVTAGITLDNVTDDIAGVTKINVPTSTLVAKGGGEVDLIPHITLRNTPPSQQDNLAKEIHLLPPLKTYADPNAQEVGRMEIDPGAYEPQHAPGYLTQLGANVGIIGTSRGASNEHDGVIFCDNDITPPGAYFEIRRAEKSYGIQDASDDDPNISGGMPTEVMAYISFIGHAPADGNVRCYWRVKRLGVDNEDYLLDPQGNPIITEVSYKLGERLMPELVAGIVEAKGLEYLRLHVMHTFTGETVLLDHAKTYICFQQQQNGYKTSVAKLEFEKRTGITITPHIDYLGPNEVELKGYLSKDKDFGAHNPGDEIEELGQFSVHAVTEMKGSISGGMLVLESVDDVTIADFDFHHVASATVTKMARGHNVKFDIKIQDKNSGWRLGLYAWKGNPDAFSQLYNSRNNGALILNPHWVKVAETFISEDVVSGIHPESVSGTIPDDANNYGFFIYPVEAQAPIKLQLADAALSYEPAFTGFVEDSPELDAEKHLVLDEKYKKFVQNTQGFASLRYTLNNVPAGLPLPCGVPSIGAADVELDPSVNKVSGSMAKGGEGAAKSKADGPARVTTTALLWNEQAAAHVATLWWAKVSSDGQTFTKIPESEVSRSIPAHTAAHGVSVTWGFDMDMETGTRIALRGSTDATDGVFLKCVSDAHPLVETQFAFKELVPSLSSNTTKRLTRSELHIIPFSGQTGQNYTFEFFVPDGAEIGMYSVESRTPEGELVSTATSEISYDDSTDELTVHIGNVQDGKIKIELWG